MESGIQKEYNAGSRARNESEVSGSQALLLVSHCLQWREELVQLGGLGLLRFM